jgi:hypothetical protein
LTGSSDATATLKRVGGSVMFSTELLVTGSGRGWKNLLLLNTAAIANSAKTTENIHFLIFCTLNYHSFITVPVPVLQ